MQYKIEGKGRPLLLVPGGLTGWISWEPIAKILSAERTVIRVQLLNVEYAIAGRNLPDDYSVITEKQALENTLTLLDLKYPIDIVGWSYGAFTSLQFALDNKDRVRTLTLIEPPAMWVLYTEKGFDNLTQEEADFFLTLKGDVSEDMLARFLVHAGFVQPGGDPRQLPQWNNWINFRNALRNSVSLTRYRDDLKRLKELHMPVLLVKGTGSSEWLHRVIDTLWTNIPESRIIELPGGHAAHLISQKEFLKNLTDFQENAVDLSFS